jgi:predicted hotdog family 3-hydroxylacyl-ACP dehydratase
VEGFMPVIWKNENIPMIDIEALIPHREPIKIITEVIDLQDNSGIAGAVVNSGWPLHDGKEVNSLVLIEAIAQTSALIEGYKRSKEGKEGVKGWLVGIKSAEFHVAAIPDKTRLTIHVNSLYSFDNYGVIEGVVKSGKDVFVTAVLQALRMNEDTD